MNESKDHICRKCRSKMNPVTNTSQTITSSGNGSSPTTSTVDYTSACASSCNNTGSSGYRADGMNGSSGYSGYGERKKSTYKCEKCGHEMDVLIDY